MSRSRPQRMHTLIALAATMVCLAGCLLVPTGCSHTPQEGQSFRFPLAGEPQELDPQTASDASARTVMDVLFEGLTALQNGVAVPAAATWTVSPNGKQYTFTLTDSAWSNGDPVTADDFLFAYERTTDPATASPHAAALANIAGVEAPDTRTLLVTLTEADDAFPTLLAGGVWYPCPRAFFTQCGGGWGMEADKLLQNGPFTLESWSHGSSLLLRKNEHYHAASSIAPGTVRFVIGADQSAASIENGTLDGCTLSEDDFSDQVTVTTVTDTLRYLWFNTTVAPLDNAAIRRALRDAVEWETVTAALPDAASSYVSADARLYGEPYRSPLAPHQTAADKAAFSQALNDRGMTACPALTLLCADDAGSRQLAQYIVQSWQKNLSVYLTIEPLAAEELLARIVAGNYHLAIADATAPGASPADALLLFDGTAAEGNWARYENAAWANAVAHADSAAALAAAEQELADACPAVPLVQVTRRFGLAADMTGVTVLPFVSRFDFLQARR